MMDDLVQRLREIPVWMVGEMIPGWQDRGATAYEAADTIETLRAERAALRTIAINHLWNHNLANAYGRDEYQKRLAAQVDETLANMMSRAALSSAIGEDDRGR